MAGNAAGRAGGLLLALWLFVAVVGAVDIGSARAQESAAAETLQRLTITTKSGPHVFRVEFERTPAELERGLMYRRSLPQDRGMLFDFQQPQPVQMWMKNTYIPLDMIFIAKDGRVTHIARDAEPLSERIISSDGPAFAVLEVNAGVADRIDLKAGDRVEDPIFSR